MLEALKRIQYKAQAIESKYKERNAWLDDISLDDEDLPVEFQDSPPQSATDAHAALLAALGL